METGWGSEQETETETEIERQRKEMERQTDRETEVEGQRDRDREGTDRSAAAPGSRPFHTCALHWAPLRPSGSCTLAPGTGWAEPAVLTPTCRTLGQGQSPGKPPSAAAPAPSRHPGARLKGSPEASAPRLGIAVLMPVQGCLCLPRTAHVRGLWGGRVGRGLAGLWTEPGFEAGRSPGGLGLERAASMQLRG